MTSVSTFLETGRCIEWRTELPNGHAARQSPQFLVLNKKCYFLFVREWSSAFGCSNSGYKYCVYLKPVQSSEKLPSFAVEVHVGVPRSLFGTDLFSGSVSLLTGANMHQVWCVGEDDLKSRARSDFRDGRPLKFIFIFDRHVVLKLRSETGDKSVQTTISMNPASVQPSISTNPYPVQASDVSCGKSCPGQLSGDFAKLLGNAEHDVFLKCGERTFRAHETCVCSSVFAAQLKRSASEGRTTTVALQGTEETRFLDFLRYLYSGRMPELSWDCAKRLHAVGDKYAVESLKKRCSVFLAENLTAENACDCLAVADVQNDVDLKEIVIPYILDNGIPLLDDQWLPFVRKHPRMADEVLRRFYRQQKRAS